MHSNQLKADVPIVRCSQGLDKLLGQLLVGSSHKPINKKSYFSDTAISNASTNDQVHHPMARPVW